MHPIRVCVADDNADTASVLCEALRPYGYESVTARTGLEAFEVCRTTPIDLVLLDVCMPGMDGFEVCRRLKMDPRTQDIAVIFVTVKGSREDRSLGLKLGAADYVTKPFDPARVMILADKALRAAGKLSELSDTGEPDYDDGKYTDPLTGLRNRAFLIEKLGEELSKARRYSYPVSCVAFDISDVSAMDDELGPVSLDDLLAELGMAIHGLSRASDTVARYEDRIFVSVLPHSPLDSAHSYALKILEEVDATTFSDPSFPTLARVCCGITCCGNGDPVTPDEILGQAMKCLLQATSGGNGRIVARRMPAAPGVQAPA